jgi:hypothetical protein
MQTAAVVHLELTINGVLKMLLTRKGSPHMPVYPKIIQSNWRDSSQKLICFVSSNIKDS